LTKRPCRSEEELDPVTLHNQALVHFEEDPQAGFRKLNFLLQNPPFPHATLRNLLILYLKHEAFDLAADILAENMHLSAKHLDADLADFMEATITVQTSPAEAYRKFDMLTARHIDSLRKYTKQIQDARLSKNSAAIKQSLEEYDAALERYIPVLMGMAKVYWDREHWDMVERLFRQSGEFCSEHPTWKLNVGHAYFMKERFDDAIRYYEPVVHKSDELLDVTAIILANLCVSYIMTSRNEVAEELMRRIEKAERFKMESDPKPSFHLCIVNLVIGTLYCAKGNFEFGVSRVMKSLQPYERKLGMDTWFYAKRCMLGLAEAMAKHMVVLRDATFKQMLKFLQDVSEAGKDVITRVEQADATVDPAVHNVRVEARMLMRLFLRIREQ
jgi:tetratricopeptide repeat protein 30